MSLLEGLLNGSYYQAGAANTLVPQQVGVQRQELANQSGFYDAQDTLARSDPFKSNPFLQMMTRQLSPKLSPSDQALRGLAYGQTPGATSEGLADQFKPASMFSLSPSNMAGQLSAQLQQQGVPKEQADWQAYQMANQGNKAPVYDKNSGDYKLPVDIYNQQQGGQNPVAQSNAPKQQAPQPLPPIQQRQQNSAGLQPSNVNQPQMVDDNTIDGITPQQPQYTQDPYVISKATGLTPLQVKTQQNYPPEKLQEEITAASDEQSQIEQSLPQLAKVRQDLMNGDVNTGPLEGSKNLLTGAVEDIFGKDAIDPAAKNSLVNQGLVDYLGTKQALQGMTTYFTGKGAVSDAEGKKLNKLGVALGDNEFKNVFVGISSELLSEARLQKLKAKQEYIGLTGSPTSPLVSSDGKVEAKNWQQYYDKNYKSAQAPFTIGFAQKIGDSVDPSQPLNNTQKIMVQNGAFDITGKVDSKGEQELRDIAKNTEGLVLKTDKGYFKIMDGQAYPLDVRGQ